VRQDGAAALGHAVHFRLFDMQALPHRRFANDGRDGEDALAADSC
jgi:hypothetical protein